MTLNKGKNPAEKIIELADLFQTIEKNVLIKE